MNTNPSSTTAVSPYSILDFLEKLLKDFLSTNTTYV
jgi:hypothetical protein